MGEIKSTLDIIMEKTKNLTVTEEEKRAFKEKETAGKVKGLVQRYADGLITRQRFAEEVADLERESRDKTMVRNLLVVEAMGRIQLGHDNGPVLGLLEMVPGAKAAEVQDILEDFEDRVERQRDELQERLKLRLGELGISGSAVLPNLEGDQDWRQRVAEIEREMREKLLEKSCSPAC